MPEWSLYSIDHSLPFASDGRTRKMACRRVTRLTKPMSGSGSLPEKRDFGILELGGSTELKRRAPLNTDNRQNYGDPACTSPRISATTAEAPLDSSRIATGECGSAARRTRRRINIVSLRGPV